MGKEGCEPHVARNYDRPNSLSDGDLTHFVSPPSAPLAQQFFLWRQWQQCLENPRLPHRFAHQAVVVLLDVSNLASTAHTKSIESKAALKMTSHLLCVTTLPLCCEVRSQPQIFQGSQTRPGSSVKAEFRATGSRQRKTPLCSFTPRTPQLAAGK